MIELSDIPFSLDAEQLMRALHIRPGSEHVVSFLGLLDRVVEVGRPKAVYRVSYVDDRTADSVSLDGVRLTSRALRKNLDSVERVFPYVATCGTEADEIKPTRQDTLQDFWLWTIREALLDAALDHLHEHLTARYQVEHWGSMHPGSGDADLWPLEQQGPLFSLLGDVDGATGVRLTESLLMIPEMSVSGIIFPTETGFASCRVCHHQRCPKRMAPFDEELYRAVCAD